MIGACTVANLLSDLPPYKDQWILIHPKQSVRDIILEVLDAHKEFAPYYDNIALYFDAGNTSAICKKLYNFLKSNIKYREEKEEDQTTALPAGILTRGYGDCKHYSSFAGGVLDSLNRVAGKKIKWNYRFASYNPFDKNPHHVFVVVEDNGNEIWIDPTPGSEVNDPIWQIDKKINVPMALRRNIAGFDSIGISDQPIEFVPIEQTNTPTVYVENSLPVAPNEELAPAITEQMEQVQADEEITPEMQSAIELLLLYGVMNDKGEISDTVLNNLAPTLTMQEFERVANARTVILNEVHKAVSIGSFLSNIWRGVKKVTLSAPRNAYLSLVALNAFGYATKLHNAIYNSDGTFWQPGQNQVYTRWNKFGGDWKNLRNAINSGAKKKALLGEISMVIDPECLDSYYISRMGFQEESDSIGVAPAAIPAWVAVATALIAAFTPLVLAILKQRSQAGQLPEGIDPNTGLPYGANPGADPGGSGSFFDKIKQFIQDNPLPVALAAAGVVYVITEKPKPRRAAQ